MKTMLFIYLLFLGLGVFSPGDGDSPQENQDQSKFRREVKRSNENTVYVRVQIGHGQVFIDRAPQSRIFVGEFSFTHRPPVVAYEVVGDEGRLSVKFARKQRKSKEPSSKDDYDIELDKDETGESVLNFTDEIPLNLNLDLGVIEGRLNLGGLQIQECEITTAVSKSASVEFSHPNPIPMRSLRVENGVGKMKLLNLGNANFSDFYFSGGVGSYRLDFRGELKQAANVEIEVGVGKVKLLLPRDAGVRIRVDKSFLSRFSIDEVYKEGQYYYNPQWGKTERQLDIKIDAGLGKVAVVWVDN
ncbi:MAG: hypothetical protein D6681_18015 [Calditrichaeota bacterium]|nr:MAG: hypothetical protein D6681_18015 [Calditrichota bacterium]